MSNSYKYIIVGAGLAGASAVEGIRELDGSGSILLIGREPYLPYNRPPLSKKLWTGAEKIEEIFVHDSDFYQKQKVELRLDATVVELDVKNKRIYCSNGNIYWYEKLLLATGGAPRKLVIPGGNHEAISYFRQLNDYNFLRGKVSPDSSAVVIGGGFIGSEIAAALNMNKVDVTMIFPDKYLVQRVFPESLGRAIQEQFKKRGIKVLSGDIPTSIERKNDKFVTRTRGGKSLESNMVVVGVGIDPSVALANAAGLDVANGIIVDEYLQTSEPDVYAAGDNANFPYHVLNQRMRVEHWDNALNQGKLAGKNMAGAHERYDYMPYFFSDLFEFGYEAVGEVDSRLQIVTDWQKENEKGIIYYLKDGRVRGAMMCNVWNKVDWARDLIKRGLKPEHLQLPKVV